MKRFTIFTACFLVCFIVAGSSAEMYMGIYPLMRMVEVKKMFPGATYEKRFPAWAKEDDAMYSVSGSGISGEIIIKFYDPRVWYREDMEKATDNITKRYYRGLVENSEDNSLVVSWVRWVPSVPFPVERMITKYGKPEKSDFSSVDFSPFKEWTSKGIYVHLSDDGKKVLMVDYTFTSTDYKESADKRFKSLQETPPPLPKKDIFDDVSGNRDGKGPLD